MGTNKLKGVKKVSERILQGGRAMIITEEEASKLNWSKIPYGTFMINDSGALFYKIKEFEGNETTSWVPTNIHNSDAIQISKNAKIVKESYTITNANIGNGRFRYELDWTKGEGHDTEEVEGFLNPDTGGQIFILQKGDYLVDKNKIEVIIDNKIYCQESGGIKELTPERFELLSPVTEGTKVLVKYIQDYSLGEITGIGAAIFYSETEPEAAGVGDIWFQPVSEPIE